MVVEDVPTDIFIAGVRQIKYVPHSILDYVIPNSVFVGLDKVGVEGLSIFRPCDSIKLGTRIGDTGITHFPLFLDRSWLVLARVHWTLLLWCSRVKTVISTDPG